MHVCEIGYEGNKIASLALNECAITVNNDLGSRGNTFPAEVEFSDKNQRLPPCLFLSESVLFLRR